MQSVFLILLFILGACLGSFLCCQARRLHLKTTNKTKSHLSSRSVCLSCGYQLKWYDNLPIISWLFLKGKCRKCDKKIGFAEILSELGVALAFLLLGLGQQLAGFTIESSCASPLEIITFATALVLISLLAFLAIYDGIYGQLPTLFLVLTIIFATVVAILREWANLSISSNFWPDLGQDLLNLFLATLILSGLYLVLYKISKGKWVGDGDWLLGLALALALGTPWLALVTLFLANFLACLVMFPVVKKHQERKIHFGPFMVVAFVVVFAFSHFFYAIISL